MMTAASSGEEIFVFSIFNELILLLISARAMSFEAFTSLIPL
jgi:hypothetical protein